MTAAVASDVALAVRRVSYPIGELTIVASDAGVRAVLFAQESLSAIDIGNGVPSRQAIRHAHRAAEQLQEYFDKQRRDFEVDLDVLGTEFQRRVWSALSEIPYGETISYAEQALRVADRGAARAVGAANGRNPVPIIVPCHRVVGSDGTLTGYAGGTDAKAFLLRHEQWRQPSLFDL